MYFISFTLKKKLFTTGELTQLSPTAPSKKKKKKRAFHYLEVKCNKQNKTYPVSGNLSEDGFQYSMIPLSSAEITVSYSWLYFIHFTGPR